MQLSIDVMNLIQADSIVATLVFLTCRVPKPTSVSADDVAKYCDITVIEKLNVGRLVDRAALFNRFDILHLYYYRRPSSIKYLDAHTGFPWRRACSGPHNTLVECCYKYKYSWSHVVSSTIARHGNLEMLKWVTAHGCPWHDWISSDAAASGNLEVLKYCAENGSEWRDEAYYGAAARGNLEMLQWCHANGFSFDEVTSAYAASGGHLELLKWLRANNCPWEEGTTTDAAHGGHIDTLKWCRANGCPWNFRVCSSAAANGDLDMLQWARANGCNWIIEDCLSGAIANKHFHIVEWINSQ
jgi:hypothetical protein